MIHMEPFLPICDELDGFSNHKRVIGSLYQPIYEIP